MKTFLKNLDRKAGRLLSAMDDQLHEPIVRTMTGDVFVHSAVEQDCQIAPEQAAAAQQPPTPTRPLRAQVTAEPVGAVPVLRRAGALDTP